MIYKKEMFARAKSIFSLLFISVAVSRSADPPLLHCYISTGDNQWLGQSLPIDSPASIDASIDLLHRLGVKRLYWRGLEAAAWVETVRERPENPRYFRFWKWLRWLYREVEPDRLAVEAAHKRGMEIWGVGNLFDWGAQGDVPPFKYYPYGAEAGLRIDHPEWVPVDRSGLLKQGGPIELAYPEARKALVDLHAKIMRRDGYDGMTFLTYAENHSMRFQDEFGFSEPIVQEFQRRHGIDLRHQEWTRFASREDWRKLRGEYVTEFLRELNEALPKKQRNVGFFLQPWNPRQPQPWNVPEVIGTAGSMYFDLETWVREGLVNDFLVYGYADRRMQVRAVRNMRWMTRDTPVNVGILTSGPKGELWKPFQAEGVPTCIAYSEDAMYLDRSFVPEQPMSSLKSDDPLLVMKALSQVVHGKSKADFAAVEPLLQHPHLIVRRLAIQSLGKIGGDEAVASIEAALFDPENSIRCMAGVALRDAHGPKSVWQIMKAIELHGNHMLAEIMRVTLPRIRPLPREDMIAAYRLFGSVNVRQMAIRALIFMPHPSVIPTWNTALNDPDRFTRVAAVRGLSQLKNDTNAIRLLIETVGHEDPVMADEACMALGLAIESNAVAADELRAEIFPVIRDRYARFGEGYSQVDAAWGYRPVGNALLAFGAEGERALQSFIDQSRDRQLAIRAWKSLYIRQRPNTFSEVTEKENAEAMRRRPLFLKQPVVPRLVQDFDDRRHWQPTGRGMVGDVNRVSGRWGALLDEGPFITRENAPDGGQALVVKRGGQAFSGQAVPAVDDQADYQLSFRVFRQTDSSATVVQLRGIRGVFQSEFSVNLATDGRLLLRDMKADQWESTGLVVPPRKWASIRLLANRRSQSYSATVEVDGHNAQTSRSFPLTPQPNLRSIVIYPQPPADSVVLIDDISLMEVR